MTVVHESVIDGVKCFWVETGRPTLAASLIFRQGLVDEPLNETGWLHLTEHLALHGKGGGRLSINGSVDLMTTTFDAHGPADLVAEHLADVTQWLTNPNLGGLDHERDVLAAESALRGGPVGRALAWRYGARGPGVSNYDEPGLARATEADLIDRAQTIFTRDNAVVVLDGPPDGLNLHLRAGTFLPPSPAVPCEDSLPAMYVDDAGLVLSGVVDRSGSAVLVPVVLERMLKARLRDEVGAAYAPWSTYVPVDADRAVVFAGSDVGPKLLPVLAQEVATLVRQIGDSGLPQEYVDHAIDEYIQAVSDPYGAFGLAYRAAMMSFDGKPAQTLDEVVNSVRSVSADTLHEHAHDFTKTLLLGIHGDAAWADEMRRLEAPHHPPRAVGDRFRHRDWPAVGDELRIDDSGVEVCDGSHARSIDFAQVEGMMSYEDGGRYLVAPDGWSVGVEPTLWRNGTAAVELIDTRVRPDRTLARPDRQLMPDSRMPFYLRWARALGRAPRTRRRAVILSVFIALATGAILFVAQGGGLLAIAAGLWIARLIKAT